MECTYCGSDLDRYDPVFLEETADGERVPAGASAPTPASRPISRHRN